MYGNNSHHQHPPTNARAFGQPSNRSNYKNATGWETTEQAQERAKKAGQQAEIDRTPKGVNEAIRRLRQRYETIRNNPDLALKIQETRAKTMRVRDLIKNCHGTAEQRSDFFTELAEIEGDFAQVGHKI